VALAVVGRSRDREKTVVICAGAWGKAKVVEDREWLADTKR